MAQYPAPPLSFMSDDLVQIAELRNGLPLQDYNLTDAQFENFICTNLTNENLPYDLTDNFPYDASFNPSTDNSSLSIVNDEDVNGPQLLGKTVILNNETLINSESFAIKMNYASTGSEGNPDSTSAGIGAGIDSSIALDASTNSVYDSNLKITITPNNDDQYTDDLSMINQTIWGVNFNRNNNAMDYFATINSVYEQDENPSPFYIVESSNNTVSLGNNNSLWFNENKHGISDASGILETNSISNNYLLSTNHINSAVTNNGYTTFSEFNKYKLLQNKPATTTVLSASGSAMPIKYVNGAPVDLSSTTFDFSNVFMNTTNVGSGFTVKLDISANPTPYDVSSNELFTVDNSTLVNNPNENYIKLSNINTRDHFLEEYTGSLTAESVYGTGNEQYIDISNNFETLDGSYNATNGLIQLAIDTMWDRVYYADGFNTYLSHGTPSNLTDYVDVVYCGEENGNETTCLSGNLLTTDDVSFYLQVKATSTIYSNPNDFFNANTKNLAYDNSAILVIADTSNNSSANYEDFTLDSRIPYDANKVYIISVQNESILTAESQLLDQNLDPVTGTTSTVTMSGVDLSGLPYTDFRIRLDTKKVSDISNQLHLTNHWTLKNPNDYMIGSALKTSVIYDDYLFMTTDPHMDISMQYVFQIANPVCASTQAIKHRIKIEFKDLSENLQYNSTPTVFYLDDQDITLNPISSIDTSGVTCTDISSNNTSYPVSDYTFQKYTRTSTYTAEFDSKFQFYHNLTFITPTVTENAIFYKIFKGGIEQPSYLLRYFSCIGEGHLLSNVYVSLVGEPVYTEFKYTQTVCSILTATILGTTNNVDYVELPDVDPVPIDPFFRQNCVILNITTGGHGHADISVRFNNGVTVDQPLYYIEMQNAIGANLSLKSKRYIYDASTNGTQLDNYTPYNNFYGTLMSSAPLLYTDVSDNGGILTVTIKTASNGTTLAVISQPNNYLNDYNIILCPAPILQIDTTIGSNPTNSTRRLVFNNTVKIVDGIYYYLDPNGVIIGASESFNLVTDSFKLWFVDDEAFPNNNTAYTGNFVKFNESNIQTWLTCLSNTYNQTRSISFTQLRGYKQSISNNDIITLLRTTMSVTFFFAVDGNLAYQMFDNIYYGKTITIDNAGYNGTFYNLGLKLHFTKSMLKNERQGQEYDWYIHVSLPKYSLTVTANPFNTSIVGKKSSGYLTDASNSLFYPYFNYVKPSSIKSNTAYSVTVTYTVPDLVVYSATTPSYIGNPVDVSGWTQNATVSHNTLLNNYNVINSFRISRDSSYNVFYNNYNAYFVISPPVVSVYSNDTTTDSIPINYNPVYIGSFHINTFNNTYVNKRGTLITNQWLNFREISIKSYNSYLNVNTSAKRFRIEGNYLKVEFYAGGVGTGPSGPAAVDASGLVLDTLINDIQMTQLEDGGLYDNNHVRVVYNGYSYDIYYKQYLVSAHTNNSSENVKFNVGNAFINSPLVSYLRLPSGRGTNVTFFQANVAYDLSGIDSSYYMIIDKYISDITVNYNSFLDTSVREIFFPITNHYVKQIAISSDIVDGSGNIISYSELVDLITYNDISNCSWVEDLTFGAVQYSGITMSALTEQGRLNMQDVFKYNSGDSLDSKALYIYRPDLIRARNIIGTPIYRVTNGGNVHAPRVTTSNLSLFVAPNVAPIDSNIPGFNDIQSLFAQNSLMNDGNIYRP